MRGTARRGALKVQDGRVQKKNNWIESSNYYSHDQPLPVVDRKRPGEGYRHVLKQKDVYDFIGILPYWNELSRGLNGIVLTAKKRDGIERPDLFGWHVPGVVHLCSWERDFWTEWPLEFYRGDVHRLLMRLGVPCVVDDETGLVSCQFTENTARAFMLLDVFLHELGHHHDRMTNRSNDASRGEPFAEAYAREHGERVWQGYLMTFEL